MSQRGKLREWSHDIASCHARARTSFLENRSYWTPAFNAQRTCSGQYCNTSGIEVSEADRVCGGILYLQRGQSESYQPKVAESGLQQQLPTMGFTTGFLGGLTLTYSLVYLSVYVHRSNRTHQSLLLRQQARLLNSSIDPPEAEYEPPVYRIEKAGIEEQLKDRWNREVEKLVRNVQTTDWEALRLRIEDRLGNAFGRVRETEQVKELEQQAKKVSRELEHQIEDGTKVLNETVKDNAQQLQKQAQKGAQEAEKKARQAAREVEKKARQGAQEVDKKVRTGAKELQKKVQDGIAGTKEAAESAKQSTERAVHGKRLLEL